MKRILLPGLMSLFFFTEQTDCNAQFAVSLQGNTKLLLEDFKGDAFYGGGIRGDWYPFGNVGISAGFNYYNGIQVDDFVRLEKKRQDVTPSFFLADLTTFYDRLSFESAAKLYPLSMEYDDPLASYIILGFSLDYIRVQNDVGTYNATDYQFPRTTTGESTEPIDEESMIGLYFNFGFGVQYEIGLINLFAEAHYALVGSQFNADDKQYELRPNVNAALGVRYHFRTFR